MNYIRLSRLQEKLKTAEEYFTPVIMTAGSGWGKSAAAAWYYRRKHPLFLTAEGGKLSSTPAPASIRANVVVFDEMQFLTRSEDIRCLKGFLASPGIQVVMLTRGAVPKYLAAEDLKYGFVHITEEDLAFGPEETEAFFREKGVLLHEEDILPVTKASKGYVTALYYYAMRMAHGKRYSPDIEEAVWNDLFHLWDGALYEGWKEEYKQLALAVCAYDDFTVEMAEYLSGNPDVGKVIEFCRGRTNQLMYVPEDRYSLRPEIKRFFQWKKKLILSSKERRENYRRGAEYYAGTGDLLNALKYYEKAGEREKITELLILGTRNMPGRAHFVKSREFYLGLSEEEIRKHPALMAGMSIIQDLFFMASDSERWYDELKGFVRREGQDDQQRKEGEAWLDYLGLMHSHRGLERILQTKRQNPEGRARTPVFDFTGGMPSVLSGSLNLWDHAGKEESLKLCLLRLMDRAGVRQTGGLLDVALAERAFEQGGEDDYAVFSALSAGFEGALHGGRLSVCFASVGIQARLYLVQGKLPDARRICTVFRENLSERSNWEILPNLEALEVWLTLMGGSEERAKEYADSLPDARVSLSITDGYRQLVKLRCLIALNRLEEALELSDFLSRSFAAYERPLWWIESQLLKGVILCRTGEERYADEITAALKKAAELHLLRPVSLEGAALGPILSKMSDRGIFPSLGAEYKDRLREECRRIARFYPDYLKFIPMAKVRFTGREEMVLSLLLAGRSTEEICRELNISYDGLKKHNRNIYKKLGVKNRTEAERKAFRLGLTHRGG